MRNGRNPNASGQVAVRPREQAMGTEIATDDVTDGIVQIEMYRQLATKEAGLAVSCSEALRKLHELLDRERADLQRQESGTGHSANIDALTNEIEKVKKMARTANGEAPIPKQIRPGQQQLPRQNAPRQNPPRQNAPPRPAPARNKGRRSMGRPGDR